MTRRQTNPFGKVIPRLKNGVKIEGASKYLLFPDHKKVAKIKYLSKVASLFLLFLRRKKKGELIAI